MSSEVMMISLLYFRWAACPVPSGSQRSWKHRQAMQGWTPHGCQHQPRSMRVMHIWQHPGLEVPIWCLGKAGRGDDWESLSVKCSYFLRRFSTCFQKSLECWSTCFLVCVGVGPMSAPKSCFRRSVLPCRPVSRGTYLLKRMLRWNLLVIFLHHDTSLWWVSSIAIYWSDWHF